MPGNTFPIFTKRGQIGMIPNLTLANVARDGTGVVDVLVAADATNGGFLRKIVVQPRGTNVATVLRFFVNNGGATTVAANNVLFRELSMPATTATEIAAVQGNEIPINDMLPIGHRIIVTMGTAVAGGIAISAWAGDY